MVDKDSDRWDLTIKPHTGLFDLNLGEIWRYRDLIWLFVKRDFSAQYKQTILGPLWHVVQPIFTTLIFLLVFGSIANLPTDGIKPKLLFYLSGITIWNYFSACLTATSNTFVANAGIFGKVYFPRLVIPLSTVLSNIIKFGIQFSLLLAVMIWFALKNANFYFGATWLIVPLLALMMAGLGLGLGIIISSLTTKYRDLTLLITFAVQLLMYATPIAYPMSYLKDKSYVAWIAWNPLTPIVEAFRYALFGAGELNLPGLVFSGGVIVILLFAGMLVFNKVERTFMDTV